MLTELISGLDSKSLPIRLSALEALCDLERNGKLGPADKLGPALPNYIHVHTTASYGHHVPGVHSSSRMIWAAHEAQAAVILLIEHESVSHMEEARAAAEIVNRGRSIPLRPIFGVEFKAPIGLADRESRLFSEKINEAWGQGEAAWVVGVGIRPSPELSLLVSRFQEAKRQKAVQQLHRMSPHLDLLPPPEAETLLPPGCNVTDRSFSYALAKLKWPGEDGRTLENRAKTVRAMLNPGGPGYVPFPKGLPTYQQLVGKLAKLGAVPTFTAQLRGKALEENLPTLKAWGIGGLDVAGIEPEEANAEEHIRHYIGLAERHGMLLLGGADYRGFGTGWTKRAPWMDHPLIEAGAHRLASPVL